MGQRSPMHRRRKPRSSHHKGAPPGSIIVHPDAPQPIIHLMAFGPDRFTETPIAQVKDILAYRDRWPVLWVNVDGLGNAQTLRELGELFKLHHLALEDVVNVHQRAKVDVFGDLIYCVTHMIRQSAPLETEQISLFLGKGFVLTFQETPGDCLDPIRNRIRNKLGQVRGAGPDYLLYALLDTLLDHYFPLLEELGERLDTLEDEILGAHNGETLPRIRQAKRDLLILRRAAWPQREAFNSLLRDTLPHIQPETRVYFRDAYDHAMRLIELTEMFRELCTDLMDVYLSTVSLRTNEIMKTLTVVAAIFIPLTFVVGLYGMNFNPATSPWNMPELDAYWGYPAVLLVLALISGGMLYYFRRTGWLGGTSRND